jgi:hypothetical protein
MSMFRSAFGMKAAAFFAIVVRRENAALGNF